MHRTEFPTQQRRRDPSRRWFLFLVFFNAAVSLLQSKEDTRGCGEVGREEEKRERGVARLKSMVCLYRTDNGDHFRICRSSDAGWLAESHTAEFQRWMWGRRRVKCCSWEEVYWGTTHCCWICRVHLKPLDYQSAKTQTQIIQDPIHSN